MMMLELHNVMIGRNGRSLSMAVTDGQILGLTGAPGTGKTSLLRAILGFIPVDSGYITIDGELLTPQSAPYFRQHTAYVPQHLSVPEGCRDVPVSYLQLLEKAVQSDKPLLIVDEPSEPLAEEQSAQADRMLRDAANRGAAVVAVNPRITDNRIQL